MAQPYTPIRRSAYNSWVPQSHLIRDGFIGDLLLIPSMPGGGHKAAVEAFDKVVSKAHKDLFESALNKVTKDYEKVCQTWRHYHKLIFLL